MPEFIHERAKKIMESTKEQYGPEKGEQVAFAIANQQAHATGQAPKKWHGRPYGTPEGKREAKEKYDEPSKMQKSAVDDDDPYGLELLKEIQKLRARAEAPGVSATKQQGYIAHALDLAHEPGGLESRGGKPHQLSPRPLRSLTPELRSWLESHGMQKSAGSKLIELLSRATPTDTRTGPPDPEFINTYKGAEGMAARRGFTEADADPKELARGIEEKKASAELRTWAVLDALRGMAGAQS